MNDKLLTPKAVADRLEVSPDTVRIWLRKGMLKGIKVGGGKLWRISEASVDDFLESNQVDLEGYRQMRIEEA